MEERRHFICIDYPGRVVNPERVIETLGGTAQINQTLSAEKPRMHLNFRPNNVYSKGVYGDRTASSGVLLRVKVKRRGNEVKTEDVQIVGHSDVSYRFDRTCDYEMLPIMKRTPEAERAEYIYRDLIPSVEDSPENWLQNPPPLPYFFPPQTFTKFDTMIGKKLFKSNEKYARGTRIVTGAIRLNFNLTDPMPTEPSKDITTKNIMKEDLEVLRQKFKERPIWSANALRAVTKISIQRVKNTLPHLAFRYNTGPWRTLWIPFGYDPRKEFASRNYQLLELRLNRKCVFNIKSRSELRKTASESIPTKRNVVSQLIYDDDTSGVESEVYAPTFAPGNFHQITWTNMFQFCDIEVPKIQKMLEKVPAPLHGGKCSEKTGWLPNGFEDQCREILLNILKEHFQMEIVQMKNEDPINYPADGEEGDQDSEGDNFDEEMDQE